MIIGQKITAYQRAMADADLQRYDLCGPVQNGQTGEQACAIVNEDWADGAIAFNAATSAAGRGDVEEGIAQGEAALTQLKAALVQVTVTDVLTELVDMYDAYGTYYDEQVVTAMTGEQLRQLSEDELNDLISEADTMFEAWDGALRSGETTLISYCEGLG
ncbi:MAG: hypothetical protein WA971_05010 [Microbacterium sp.]